MTIKNNSVILQNSKIEIVKNKAVYINYPTPTLDYGLSKKKSTLKNVIITCLLSITCLVACKGYENPYTNSDSKLGPKVNQVVSDKGAQKKVEAVKTKKNPMKKDAYSRITRGAKLLKQERNPFNLPGHIRRKIQSKPKPIL